MVLINKLAIRTLDHFLSEYMHAHKKKLRKKFVTNYHQFKIHQHKKKMRIPYNSNCKI